MFTHIPEGVQLTDLFGLTEAEAVSLLEGLFSFIAEQGCRQRCSGCHAAALAVPSTATWGHIQFILRLITEFRMGRSIDVQRGAEHALLETFRASDPAQYVFREEDRTYGIGDLSLLLREAFGIPVKIMTAGVYPADEVRTIDWESMQWSLDQLTTAASVAGRLSVSVSVQTWQCVTRGEEVYSEILARTFEALLAGSRQSPVFLDMMVYTVDGSDPKTAATMSLMSRTWDHLVARGSMTRDQCVELGAGLNTMLRSGAGNRNHVIMVPGTNIGVRTSPYIAVGRAAKARKKLGGQELSAVVISDKLGVRPGNPNDWIGLKTGTEQTRWTRRQLQDPDVLHQMIDSVRTLIGEDYLIDHNPTGNWFGMFRSEIDVTPGFTKSVRAGVHSRPGLNLLVSHPTDLQVTIPYKTVSIG
jgi:hypothetical protein